MNLRLTSDNILVEPLPSITKSPIVLPDIAQDEHNVGGPKLYRVLGTGPGRRTSKGALIPMEVRAGDRVIAHSYTQGPTDLGDGSKRRIITQAQVILKLPLKHEDDDLQRPASPPEGVGAESQRGTTQSGLGQLPAEGIQGEISELPPSPISQELASLRNTINEAQIAADKLAKSERKWKAAFFISVLCFAVMFIEWIIAWFFKLN